MRSMTLTNVIDREHAKSLRAALDGTTYLDLKVIVAPIGGEFQVSVETRHEGCTQEEFEGLVIEGLCHQLIRARRGVREKAP